MPSGMALLGMICAGHRSTGELHFPSGANRNKRSLLRIGLCEIFDEGVIPFALVSVRWNDPGRIPVNLQGVAKFGILGLSREDDRAVAEFHQVLAWIAADIRLFDSAG